MTDDSPDSPTVWKDIQHERLPPRLDVEEANEEQGGEEEARS